MKIYISIDDTDNKTSCGSGQLAEDLAHHFQKLNLIQSSSGITRHQLFFDCRIPYTSHNSSMCFSTSIEKHRLKNLISTAEQFLTQRSAPGSDPGLCVFAELDSKRANSLIEFGHRAKTSVCTKDEAYTLAEQTSVHLSEHGGTGDGIIGALAGAGLRLAGSDGRFRGWLNLGPEGSCLTVSEICTHPSIEAVTDDLGNSLSSETPIYLSDSRIKTIRQSKRRILPVKKSVNGTTRWATLTRKEIKAF
jgi:hypothetical protein